MRATVLYCQLLYNAKKKWGLLHFIQAFGTEKKNGLQWPVLYVCLFSLGLLYCLYLYVAGSEIVNKCKHSKTEDALTEQG